MHRNVLMLEFVVSNMAVTGQFKMIGNNPVKGIPVTTVTIKYFV